MDVNLLSLRRMFEPSLRYLVPPFQRRYVWTRDDQWEPLWNDVVVSAETCLARKQASGDQGGSSVPGDEADHFLGAVVVQHEPRPVSELQVRNLIDGQQRLVTLQLLLVAVETVFAEYQHPAATRIRQLVRNHEAYVGDDSDLAFKVWPTTGDRDAFRFAMESPLSGDVAKDEPPIIAASRFFADSARAWIDAVPAQNTARIDALEEAVQAHLKMVVIEIANTDDEHVIFETLNARGTPLLVWDLTKNFVLNRANEARVDAQKLQQTHLTDFDDPWWIEEVRGGGAARPRVDTFLNYWLIMCTAEPVEAKETFRRIQKYVDAGEQTIETIAADIGWVGSTFRELDDIDDKSTTVGMFLYRWRAMGARVLTPVLMWLLSCEPPQAQLDASLHHIESYLVRRMLCELTARGYYDLSLGLLKRLNDSSKQPVDQIVFEYLLEQETDRYRWPTDADLLEAFRNAPLYRRLPRARLRMVLEGVEEGLRTPQSDAGGLRRGLTIEHVMPQQWREHWEPPSEADLDGEEDTAQRRDSLVHTIGNLTLVNKRLNSSMANAALPEKHAALAQHSTLFLNKDLLEASASGWDEDRIVARSNRLCDVAIRVWPRPDQM